MKITLKSEYSKVSSDFEDEVNVVELTKGFITFVFGFSIKGKNLKNIDNIGKRRILRNLVNPETGKLLFELAFNFEFEQTKLAL